MPVANPTCSPTPCPPCTDDPLINTSAEDPDSDRFIFNIDVLGNPQLNELFEQLGCFAWCYSEISQADADLCAIMEAIQCENEAIRQPPNGQAPTLFFNTVQFCQFNCPDGSTFGWTFPANQVAARTLSEANRIAHSYACRYARLRRICIVSTPAPACLGEAYIGTLKASGGQPFTTSQGQCPYLWQLVSGSVPAGLSLDQCTGKVTGTPTAGGTFMFTVRATDSIGSYQQKEVTMDVEEITSTSPLPDAEVGVDYSEQLLAVPSASANELWSIVSGSLPPGLGLGSNGVISGTPTIEGEGQSFAFRARVSFVVGGQVGNCEKDFTISNTNIPTPIAYWKMDEAAGNRVDQVTGLMLVPQFGVPVVGVAGKIGNAAQFINSAFPYTSVATDAPFERTELANLGTGVTIAGWANLTDTIQLPFLLTFFDSLLNIKGIIKMDMGGGGNHMQCVGVDANSNAYFVTQTDTAVTPGDWFFFRVWFDPSEGKVKLQINDGAIAETAGGFVFDAQPKGSLEIFPDFSFNPGLIMLVDELGIFMPFLTDSQASFIYNSGSGKTCCPFS